MTLTQKAILARVAAVKKQGKTSASIESARAAALREDLNKASRAAREEN